MHGIDAYKTYLGMSLHFQGHVDGWQYNFTGKIKPETFAAKKRLTYMYAKIEREHPTKLDQIKFFYPAFKAYGYVKPDAVGLMLKAHRDYLKGFGEGMVTAHSAWIKEMFDEGFLKDFYELFACSEMLPKFYQLYSSKVMTYEQAVLMCILIPELLNTIVSQEPIVFETWKAKLLVDMKFMQLYISQPVLKQLRDATVVAFQTK